MIRHIITLLMFCCISFSVQAQEVLLKSEHPDRHVVVKGDTLWGISSKFLNDPWQWPKVWQLNRSQIKNPHLIYPGDVVFLDMSSGSPQLKLLSESITLQPGAIEEPLDKVAISTIPLSIIAPFLNQPLIIENNQLDHSPRILAAQDDRVILSSGTRVYIDKVEESDGLNWYIYRPAESLIDPDSKEVLGIEATYLGDVKITKYGEPASANIAKSKEEIFIKDRLVPTSDDIAVNFVPHAPDVAIAGRIINIYGGLAEAGPQSIITINKGASDGIEVGHVLAINRFGRVIKDPEPSKERKVERNADKSTLETGMVKLPDERVGLLMVFRVFNRVSYALVMQTTHPIYKLDSVTTP